MSSNPYDIDSKEISIWCPKQLCKWAAWFTPITASPFAIFNWLRLKEYKEACLSFIWLIAGLLLIVSPPRNTWIFILLIIIYYEIWKSFSCKRLISYSENKLYNCYSLFPIAPVIVFGVVFIISFYTYLQNSVGVPGYPNREIANKIKDENGIFFIGFNFDESHKKNFQAWLDKLRKENGIKNHAIHLRKIGKTIQERIVFQEEAIDDKLVHKQMSVMAVRHSKELFSDLKTEVHICNSDFDSMHILVPGEEHEKIYKTQVDIHRMSKLIKELRINKNKLNEIMINYGKETDSSPEELIEKVSSLLKGNLKTSKSYQFNTEEIKSFHKALNEALTFQLDSYKAIFIEIIEKSVDTSVERISAVKKRFDDFNKGFQNFAKSFNEDFNKL